MLYIDLLVIEEGSPDALSYCDSAPYSYVGVVVFENHFLHGENQHKNSNIFLIFHLFPAKVPALGDFVNSTKLRCKKTEESLQV